MLLKQYTIHENVDTMCIFQSNTYYAQLTYEVWLTRVSTQLLLRWLHHQLSSLMLVGVSREGPRWCVVSVCAPSRSGYTRHPTCAGFVDSKWGYRKIWCLGQGQLMCISGNNVCESHSREMFVFIWGGNVSDTKYKILSFLKTACILIAKSIELPNYKCHPIASPHT